MSNRLKHVLVVYATTSGCTKTIAYRIANDLIAFGVTPRIESVETLPVINNTFDAVVFGSGMRMGKWHKEARAWMQDNAAYLSTVPLACYSVGLLSASGVSTSEEQAQRELDSAIQSVGSLRPLGSVALPGWKVSEGFSALEKIALKVYPLDDGDYRDWDKVDGWVNDVACTLLGTHRSLGTTPRA